MIAHHEYGDTHSNSISVDIQIPSPIFPELLTLFSNTNDPDTNGKFDLTWSDSDNADNYSVYLFTKPITEINGSLVKLKSQTTDLHYLIQGLSEGVYYFIVETKNENGETLSDSIQIRVKFNGVNSNVPPGGTISGYHSILVLSLISLFLVILNVRRLIFKNCFFFN